MPPHHARPVPPRGGLHRDSLAGHKRSTQLWEFCLSSLAPKRLAAKRLSIASTGSSRSPACPVRKVTLCLSAATREATPKQLAPKPPARGKPLHEPLSVRPLIQSPPLLPPSEWRFRNRSDCPQISSASLQPCPWSGLTGLGSLNPLLPQYGKCLACSGR